MNILSKHDTFENGKKNLYVGIKINLIKILMFLKISLIIVIIYVKNKSKK